MSELLPCPFCGGPPELVTGGPGNWFVRCQVCKASGDDTMRDHAPQLWNARAPAQAAPTVVTDEMIDRAIDAHVELFDSGDAVGAMRAALQAVLVVSSTPAQGALDLITKKLVADAMQDAWNEICADTDRHPLDIYRVGKKTFFKPDHWADQAALLIFARVVAAGLGSPVPSTHREADELSEWKQAASVEAGLRREFMAQVDAAREFVKRHPALTLIDLAEFEAFLKVPAMVDAALSSTNLGSPATGTPSREPTGEYTITPADRGGAA